MYPVCSSKSMFFWKIILAILSCISVWTLCTRMHSVMLDSFRPMDCSPPGSSVHGIFSGKNTGASCHFLLWGIFSTQRSNLHLLHLLHWQAGSLPAEPQLVHFYKKESCGFDRDCVESVSQFGENYCLHSVKSSSLWTWNVFPSSLISFNDVL